ncbi:MAG TPA: hypothetical protein VK632_06385 [Verrucomicrobiae bacterium]|nr:hypothetical protein [Verrucomicrobiae bacterium]
MSEKEIVDAVYNHTIEQICTQLFNALINPNNVANYPAAEGNFQNGIRRAKEIRERAKQLLE